MGGGEASKKILDIQGDKDVTRIIALTVMTNEEQIQQCKAMGIKHVITHPLKQKKLHEMMYLHFHRVEKEEYRKIFKTDFNEEYDENYG